MNPVTLEERVKPVNTAPEVSGCRERLLDWTAVPVLPYRNSKLYIARCTHSYGFTKRLDDWYHGNIINTRETAVKCFNYKYSVCLERKVFLVFNVN